MTKTRRVLMWASICIAVPLALWGILVGLNQVSPIATEAIFPGSWYPTLFKLRIIGVTKVGYYNNGNVKYVVRLLPHKDRPRVRGSGRYEAYGESVSISPDGKERYTLRWPNATGKMVTWFSDGTRQEEVYLKNGQTEGLKTAWYSNGLKECEQEYKNGLKNGRRTMWHENGKKVFEEFFRNDQLHGRYTSWYENGNLADEGGYKDGMRVGIWRSHSPEGELAATLEFPDANGRWVEWYMGATRRREETYVNGKLHGKRVSYDARTGQVLEEQLWHHGDFIRTSIPE